MFEDFRKKLASRARGQLAPWKIIDCVEAACTQSKDEAVRLTPPIQMTLEKALAYIEDDERVEVTPKSIRLRKVYLDPNDRKKFGKGKASLVVA